MNYIKTINKGGTHQLVDREAGEMVPPLSVLRGLAAFLFTRGEGRQWARRRDTEIAMKRSDVMKAIAMAGLMDDSDDDEHSADIAPDVQVEKLRDALKDLQPTKFKVGDIVQLKDANSTYKGNPKSLSIVADVFPPEQTQDRGSPVHWEDTVVLESQRGKWCFFRVDSRYYKKAEI